MKKVRIGNLIFELTSFIIKIKCYIDKIKRQNRYKKIALKNLALKNKFRTFRNTVKHNKRKKKKDIKKRKKNLLVKVTSY